MSENSTIRVLIADQYPIIRIGLSMILRNEPDIEVVGEACNGLDAVTQFRIHRPDVTLMDLNMPRMDGATATQTILSEFPLARVVLLSACYEEERIYQGLRAGARAILFKDVDCSELLETVRLVHIGQKRLTAKVGEKLAERLSRPELTERQREVIRLMAQGLSNEEIAETLFISRGTVKFHVNHILAKLDASDRIQVILIALKRGLASLNAFSCFWYLSLPTLGFALPLI